MNRPLLLLLLLLVACGPSRSANEPRTCQDLGEGFVFIPPTKGKTEERVTLTPPRGFRIDRGLTGKGPVHCESELYPCEKEGGGKHVLTAADVSTALQHPEVRLVLSQGAQLGDTSNAAENFILSHGNEKLVVGKPCPTPAGMCREVPPPVKHAMEVLLNVYEHHRKLSCGALPEG